MIEQRGVRGMRLSHLLEYFIKAPGQLAFVDMSTGDNGQARLSVTSRSGRLAKSYKHT